MCCFSVKLLECCLRFIIMWVDKVYKLLSIFKHGTKEIFWKGFYFAIHSSIYIEKIFHLPVWNIPPSVLTLLQVKPWMSSNTENATQYFTFREPLISDTHVQAERTQEYANNNLLASVYISCRHRSVELPKSHTLNALTCYQSDWIPEDQHNQTHTHSLIINHL